MVNTGCTLLSSLARGRERAREDETRGETAASLIANWLRYRNNTGGRARYLQFLLREVRYGFPPPPSLFVQTRARARTSTYTYVHTYVFHSPAAMHVYAANGLWGIPHDLLPQFAGLVGALSSRCAPLVFPISPLFFLSRFPFLRRCVDTEMRVAR